MVDALIPGNISPKEEAWIDDPLFVGSMAEAIEDALDALMQADDLPALDKNASDQTVRDRRRLFVAIARGVVQHLQQHKAAAKVFCRHEQTMPVSELDVDYR